MGVFVLSAALGYAGGLIVGGYVAQHYGWRNAFILVGVASLLLGPICLLVLKEPRAKVVRRTVAEPYLAAFVELFKSPAYRCILCAIVIRSEEHTSELQSLMRISYAVFCLK